MRIEKKLLLHMIIEDDSVTLTAKTSCGTITIDDLVMVFTNLIVFNNFSGANIPFDEMQDYICDSLYEAYSSPQNSNSLEKHIH